MTTRLQLRTTIREYLEDLVATGTPLWSDAALNEFLAAAMRAYGARFPRQATATTDPIAAGATSVALPAGLLATGIVAVRDARGRDVPRASQRQGPAPIDATGLIQAWSAWAGTLRLQRPAGGDEVGVWAIDYLAGRELVADDVSQQPVEPGDEPIVVALAAAQAMKRRLVEDAKRGAPARRAGRGGRRVHGRSRAADRRSQAPRPWRLRDAGVIVRWRARRRLQVQEDGKSARRRESEKTMSAPIPPTPDFASGKDPPTRPAINHRAPRAADDGRPRRRSGRGWNPATTASCSAAAWARSWPRPPRKPASTTSWARCAIVMARLMEEEDDLVVLAGLVARVASVSIQAARIQRAITGQLAESLTDASPRSWPISTGATDEPDELRRRRLRGRRRQDRPALDSTSDLRLRRGRCGCGGPSPICARPVRRAGKRTGRYNRSPST